MPDDPTATIEFPPDVVSGDNPAQASRILQCWQKLIRVLDAPQAATPSDVERLGVSDEAWVKLVDAVQWLERCQPDELAPNAPGGKRRHLRYLAALIPTETADADALPLQVLALLNNNLLDLRTIRDVLEGTESETPMWALRGIAQRLQDDDVQHVGYGGTTYADVADEFGVSADVVRNLSTWTGVVDAREQRLAEEARRAVSEGLTNAQYAARTGVSRKIAERHMKAARAWVRRQNGEGRKPGEEPPRTGAGATQEAWSDYARHLGLGLDGGMSRDEIIEAVDEASPDLVGAGL